MRYIGVKMTGAANIDYGYCLMITTPEELVEYHNGMRKVYQYGLADAVDTVVGRRHNTSSLGGLVATMTSLREGSVVENFVAEVDGAYRAKLSVLLKYGKIYIQPNMLGFFMPQACIEEYGEIIERDGIDNPPKRERIQPTYVQWPGGKHYYVKVGAVDVVVDGQQKWETWGQAHEAYKKWKRQNGR